MGKPRRKKIATDRMLDSPSGTAFLQYIEHTLGSGYTVTPSGSTHDGFHSFWARGANGKGLIIESPGIPTGTGVLQYIAEFVQHVSTPSGPVLARVRVVLHRPQPALYRRAGRPAPPAADQAWWRAEQRSVAEHLDYVSTRADPVAEEPEPAIATEG